MLLMPHPAVPVSIGGVMLLSAFITYLALKEKKENRCSFVWFQLLNGLGTGILISTVTNVLTRDGKIPGNAPYLLPLLWALVIAFSLYVLYHTLFFPNWHLPFAFLFTLLLHGLLIAATIIFCKSDLPLLVLLLTFAVFSFLFSLSRSVRAKDIRDSEKNFILFGFGIFLIAFLVALFFLICFLGGGDGCDCDCGSGCDCGGDCACNDLPDKKRKHAPDTMISK